MNYPIDLEEKIERELLDKYGPEWEFLMGSSIRALPSEGMEPRRIFWATMTTYILYDGGYKRHADRDKGFLKIVNAERHHSFNEAINALIGQMKEFKSADQ